MPVEENLNKDLIKEETVEQQSAQIEVVENTKENQNRDPEKQPNDATDKVNERVETNNEKSEDKIESTKNMGGTNEDITKGRELISPVLKKMEDLKNEMAQKLADVAKKYEDTIVGSSGLGALDRIKVKKQADAEKLQAEEALSNTKAEEESKLVIERQAEVEAEKLAQDKKEAKEKADLEAKELEQTKAELANLDGYKAELTELQKEQAELNEYLAKQGDSDVEAARGELEAQLASVTGKANALIGKIDDLKNIELEVDEKEMGKNPAMIKHLEKYGNIETNPSDAGNYWQRVKRAINEGSSVDQQKTKEFIDKAIVAGTLKAGDSFENIPKQIKLDTLHSELDKSLNLDPDTLKSLCEESQKLEKELGSDSHFISNTVGGYILNKYNTFPKEKLLGLISQFLNNDQKYIDQVQKYGIEGTETVKIETSPSETVTENPVPVPPVPENKDKNIEKSAEQIELEKLKLELQEKNQKHKENYDQRESVIKLIEEIKNKKGYTEGLKELNKKVIPYESVLAAVLPDKKSGLDNLQKLLSSTEDAKDKERIQKLIDKVQSIPEEDVKNLAQNLSYNSYGISTASFSRMDTFKHEDLGKLLSNPSIDTAISNASFTHKRVSEFEDKIAKDPEIIEQQNKLSELVKQNEVDYKEVRRVEREIEKLEVNS